LKDPVSYFFYELNNKPQSALFKRLLYAYVILRCVLWLADYDLLFGDHSIVFQKNYELGSFKKLAFLLYNRYHVLCYPAIIFSLALSILGFFNKGVYLLSDLLLWLLILNLNNAVYPTLTGGDLLLNQVLLFNCILSNDFKNNNSVRDQLRICLHNFGVLAILVQVCFLYFVSGLTKVLDASWAEGTAINIISRVNHYNLFHPIVFDKNSIVGMGLNYLVMFYQLLFPFIIWFNKIKKPFLVIGLVIHIYISLVLGLPSFGIVMLIPYVFFWPYKKESRQSL
jgi:hypothetical protein